MLTCIKLELSEKMCMCKSSENKLDNHTKRHNQKGNKYTLYNPPPPQKKKRRKLRKEENKENLSINWIY